MHLPEIELPDIFHRHLPAGPTFKSLSALMEQHVHTVEGVAACFLCGAQEQGFPGVVDDVAHHQTRMEEGGIRDQGSVCVGSHAYGGGVDEYVGLVQTVPERSTVRQIKETDPAVAAGMDPLDFLGD